jgi:hypothetical protein
MSKTIIQDYYKYCDDLVKDWINNNANLTVDDPFLHNSGILSGKPYFDIMPEPFLGNPDNCSIVMINLNPGYTIGDDVKLSRQNTNNRFTNGNLKGYSDFAKLFPYLSNPAIHPAGADWWKGRKEYLDRLVHAYTGKNTTRFPFAMELCPWHSNKWEEAKVKMGSTVYYRMIHRAVIPAIYAAGKSEAKIAVVIGKAAIPVIEKAGFKLIQSWGPEKRVLGKKTGEPYDYLMNNISFPNSEYPEMIYPQTVKHRTDTLANGKKIKVPLGESDAEVFYRYFKANITDLNINKELLSELPVDELKVLSIFKSGSNNTPGPEFYDRGIEQTILDFIKTH